MIRRAAILAWLAFLPAAFAADDLPAGVLLLSRVKRHIREQVERLPDYTCLQTAARFRRAAGARPPANPTDVVVLEVLNTGSKELYAPPGASDFRNEHPGEFTAGGLSGTGMFGLFLSTLFVDETAMFQYRGEEDVAGRRVIRWDYRVPLMLSGFTIQLDFATGNVAMKGSFRVDPKTLDLLWLEVQADEIPPNLQLVSAVQTIAYARTRIGDRDIVLPQTAELRMVETTGADSRNLVEFTHCRSFSSESKLSFDAPPEPSGGKAPARKVERAPVPPGLTVPIELWSPVTGEQPVGSLIEARVSAAVKEKGKVVLPAGAVVRGRIRRLEREDGYYVVGLEFTDIDAEDGPARFYANLVDIDKRAKFVLHNVTRGPRRQGVSEEIYVGRYLPGVASFFIEGAELRLPRGFKSVWKTTNPRSISR